MKIKNIIKLLLNQLGYKITKVNYKPQIEFATNIFSMEKALERCITRDLNIKTVIDVGA